MCSWGLKTQKFISLQSIRYPKYIPSLTTIHSIICHVCALPCTVTTNTYDKKGQEINLLGIMVCNEIQGRRSIFRKIENCVCLVALLWVCSAWQCFKTYILALHIITFSSFRNYWGGGGGDCPPSRPRPQDRCLWWECTTYAPAIIAPATIAPMKATIAPR